MTSGTWRTVLPVTILRELEPEYDSSVDNSFSSAVFGIPLKVVSFHSNALSDSM